MKQQLFNLESKQGGAASSSSIPPFPTGQLPWCSHHLEEALLTALLQYKIQVSSGVSPLLVSHVVLRLKPSHCTCDREKEDY